MSQKQHTLCFMLYALCFVTALPSYAADFPSAPQPGRATAPVQQNPVPLSQSGLIQNVQSYSSNPFYKVGSPYNQKMPVPVYVQGTELTAGDCQIITASIVANVCAMRNNCTGLSVSDIRPAVLQQLSIMPGHNYISACNGYVDGAFAQYKNSSINATGAFPSAFPSSGGVAAQSADGVGGGGRELILRNNLNVEKPEWLKGIIARGGELEALQAQNADDPRLVANHMPQTFADLSFEERNKVLAEGYQKWAPKYKTEKDANGKLVTICIENCPYQTITIESDERRFSRETDEYKAQVEAEKQKTLLLKETDRCAWCKRDMAECKTMLEAEAKEKNEKEKKDACEALRTDKSKLDIKKTLYRVVPNADCGLRVEPLENGETYALKDCEKFDTNELEKRAFCTWCKQNPDTCRPRLKEMNEKWIEDECRRTGEFTVTNVQQWDPDPANCPSTHKPDKKSKETDCPEETWSLANRNYMNVTSSGQ